VCLGALFPGGRHFTTLVMKTLLLSSPIDAKSSVRNLPAAPTKGRPSWSSLSPGPSPTNMTSAPIGPSPRTACDRPCCSSHFVQVNTSEWIAKSSSAKDDRLNNHAKRQETLLRETLRAGASTSETLSASLQDHPGSVHESHCARSRLPLGPSDTSGVHPCP